MARRRRSRARENPGAGFWIAVGVGVVAVGGVAYVMTRPTTAAAATTPQPTISPPLNDAATFSPSQSAGGSSVTLTYTANGRDFSSSYTPNAGALATDMSNAVMAAESGHGAGKEGEYWKARALVDGASTAQVSQLQSYGYTV